MECWLKWVCIMSHDVWKCDIGCVFQIYNSVHCIMTFACTEILHKSSCTTACFAVILVFSNFRFRDPLMKYIQCWHQCFQPYQNQTYNVSIIHTSISRYRSPSIFSQKAKRKGKVRVTAWSRVPAVTLEILFTGDKKAKVSKPPYIAASLFGSFQQEIKVENSE